MDIFSTTVTAGNLLYEFISACAEFSDDAKSLALRFKWDLRVLSHVSDYFVKQLSSTNGQLSADDQQLLDESMVYLGELMHRIIAKRTKIETKGWLTMQWNRTRWWHYQKDLKSFEAELFEWTQRFDLRLVAMPQGLSAAIQLDDPGARSSPRLAMKRKIDEYLALPQDERIEVEDRLIVLDHETAIVPTVNVPSRRMTAVFNGKNTIVEYKPHSQVLLNDPPKLKEAGDVIRELAGALSFVDPTVTGLLPCTGFFHDGNANNPRFGLVYTPPFEIEDDNPLTLKDLFNAKDSRGSRRTAAHPLEQRLILARRIASAVYFYHSVGWVHKSIRSDNILMLEPSGRSPSASFPYALGQPYLVNFASARSNTGSTDLTLEQRENEWHLNVYRHPSRQGNNISARFTMAHDTYSLCVVLLEIGMWRPLERSESEIKGKTPEQVRQVLIKLADGAAVQMGSRYKELIQWGLGLQDGDLTMKDYTEQVLESLESLVM